MGKLYMSKAELSLSLNVHIEEMLLGNEEFVVRYYASEQYNWKILTPMEVELLHNADIKIVFVYQDVGNNSSSFSEKIGIRNAERALALAKELKQPQGSAIYFAVDYEALNDMDKVVAYFQAIKNKFNGSGYKIGVYGNGMVCNKIKQELKYADFSWLGQSYGQSGYDAYDSMEKYNIKQADYIYYNGLQFDDDVAVNDQYGQW